MNRWVVLLLGLIALGAGAAEGQSATSGGPVRLDPPDEDLVDQTGATHHFVQYD